jgi:DNA-3-methyladenine glycosylase
LSFGSLCLFRLYKVIPGFMLRIPRTFYLRTDVTGIARELLGKYLCTRFEGIVTSGMIIETEAYEGITDRASHAFGGRFTGRTEVMYRKGGLAYVYLCYGIHSLFNIVTNQEGIPHAVLIRGIRPKDGIKTMLSRTGNPVLTSVTGCGPGKVSKLLGIHYSVSGMDLCRKPTDSKEPAIWLEDRGVEIEEEEILSATRIGVDYAGKDSTLPYRFVLKDSETSGRKIKRLP